MRVGVIMMKFFSLFARKPIEDDRARELPPTKRLDSDKGTTSPKKVDGIRLSTLPGEVSAAIDGATFFRRSDDENGHARVIVQLHGLQGWLHGHNDEKRFANAFPELTDAQISRACRYLDAAVIRHTRATQGGGNSAAVGWVNDW